MKIESTVCESLADLSTPTRRLKSTSPRKLIFRASTHRQERYLSRLPWPSAGYPVLLLTCVRQGGTSEIELSRQLATLKYPGDGLSRTSKVLSL